MGKIKDIAAAAAEKLLDMQQNNFLTLQDVMDHVIDGPHDLIYWINFISNPYSKNIFMIFEIRCKNDLQKSNMLDLLKSNLKNDNDFKDCDIMITSFPKSSGGQQHLIHISISSELPAVTDLNCDYHLITRHIITKCFGDTAFDDFIYRIDPISRPPMAVLASEKYIY